MTVSTMNTHRAKPLANATARKPLQFTGPLAATTSSIYALPDDILLLIIGHINVKDIIAIRKTCKRFHSLTKLRWVWTDAVKHQVIEKGLPIPAAGHDIKTFSAEHLETRAVHVAKLHDNWYSQQPRARRAIEFQANCNMNDVAPDEQPRRAVKQVLFLTGRSGEFIVTLVGGILSGWEVPLDGSGAYRIAEWTEHQNVEQVVVNEDPNHGVELACWAPEPHNGSIAWIFTLMLDTFHGCFKLKSALRSVRDQITPLHAMRGDYIVMGDPLLFWYSMAPPSANSILKLHGGPVEMEENRLLKLKFIGRHILSVRESSLQLFATPRWSEEHKMFAPLASSRSAYLHMGHTANEAVIVARDRSTGDTQSFSSWPDEAVTILLRYSDDGFETIQQYDLLPNPKAQKQSEEAVNVLPCILPADFTQTFSVAPSCCNLHVGPSGKGFWMQTSNVTTRHSVYPARCLMGFDVVKPLGPPTRQHPNPPSSGDGQVRGVREASGQNGENSLHRCKSYLYARRCDMSEIIWKRYCLTSADLEDTIGRIAVGDRVGKVEILDYV